MIAQCPFRTSLRDEVVHPQRKVEQHPLFMCGKPKTRHALDLIEAVCDGFLMGAKFLCCSLLGTVARKECPQSLQKDFTLWAFLLQEFSQRLLYELMKIGAVTNAH